MRINPVGILTESLDELFDGNKFVEKCGGTVDDSVDMSRFDQISVDCPAQVFSIAQNARYDESAISERLRDHAWFIAFAPVEDPRIAVVVLVENGRSGSGTAAPIARKIFDAYLLPPEQAAATDAITPVGETPPAGGNED